MICKIHDYRLVVLVVLINHRSTVYKTKVLSQATDGIKYEQ